VVNAKSSSAALGTCTINSDEYGNNCVPSAIVSETNAHQRGSTPRRLPNTKSIEGMNAPGSATQTSEQR